MRKIKTLLSNFCILCEATRVGDPAVRLLQLLTFVGLFFLALTSYWVVADERKPIEISKTFPTDIAYYAGETLFYHLDYCKYTNHRATVYTSWVDGLVFSVPEYASDFRPGCNHITLSREIPDILPPGEYSLEVSLVYKVNPLAERTVRYTVSGIHIRQRPEPE